MAQYLQFARDPTKIRVNLRASLFRFILLERSRVKPDGLFARIGNCKIQFATIFFTLNTREKYNYRYGLIYGLIKNQKMPGERRQNFKYSEIKCESKFKIPE